MSVHCGLGSAVEPYFFGKSVARFMRHPVLQSATLRHRLVCMQPGSATRVLLAVSRTRRSSGLSSGATSCRLSSQPLSSAFGGTDIDRPQGTEIGSLDGCP